MDITVRPYRSEDWNDVEAVHDAARRTELKLANLEAAFVPLKEAAVSEGLFDYTVLVAERDGKVLGFTAYAGDELAWLYVDPAHHGQGVGTALVRQVLVENTARPMSIEVLCGNEPARGLYEKFGFRMVRTASGVMPGNERFAVSAWCMKLEL